MLNGISYLTINTDASFHPQSSSGGYGYIITHTEGRLYGKGKFEFEVTDSNECEFLALLNALKHLTSLSLSYDVVVINCDNETVRRVVNKATPHPKFREVSESILQLTSTFPKCYAKHIKGHINSKAPRHRANNWCDRASKDYRNIN